MKYKLQQIAGVKSSTPAISVSIEIFVLRFCLVDTTIGNTRPKDKPPPECTCILGWTEKYASTQNFKIPLPLALRVRRSVRVPLMHCIRFIILDQFSLFIARTLVVNNVIVVQVSGLARLVGYEVFATRLCDSTNLFWLSFFQSLLTTKILLGEALDFVPPLFGSALSKADKISSIYLVMANLTWTKTV